MEKKNKNIFLVILTLTIFIFCIFEFSSIYLDKIADKRVENMYSRDKDGVVNGLQSIAVQHGMRRAILFIHGFSDSPAIFTGMIKDIQKRSLSDIYAPLLPFCGRDLQSISQSDNQIQLEFIKQSIQILSKKYKKVTVVGMSYGGALLAKLAYDKKIPKNVNLILYAPAFHIKSNTLLARYVAKTYSKWRDYCNYEILGCGYPSYASGDETAREKFSQEKSFKYVNVPALLDMYKFDLENRKDLSYISRPYSVVVAVDDNRVSYKNIKSACYKNKRYCRFYSFPSGKHIIHWGENRRKFENLILKLSSE
ncbi:MAG: alpha/beta fold hydrolase [Legionellaceae bacterium]|nr:alpha/beta fold hydrolase [Legionellaceae bacterium]